MNVIKSKKVSNVSSWADEDAQNIDSLYVTLNFDDPIHVNPDYVTKNTEIRKPRIKIDEEDIQDEVNFWESSVVCFVLGANPPTHVIEGFVRSIWGEMGVDKVAGLGISVTIVRFTTMEADIRS